MVNVTKGVPVVGQPNGSNEIRQSSSTARETFEQKGLPRIRQENFTGVLGNLEQAGYKSTPIIVDYASLNDVRPPAQQKKIYDGASLEDKETILYKYANFDLQLRILTEFDPEVNLTVKDCLYRFCAVFDIDRELYKKSEPDPSDGVIRSVTKEGTIRDKYHAFQKFYLDFIKTKEDKESAAADKKKRAAEFEARCECDGLDFPELFIDRALIRKEDFDKSIGEQLQMFGRGIQQLVHEIPEKVQELPGIPTLIIAASMLFDGTTIRGEIGISGGKIKKAKLKEGSLEVNA